LKGSRRYGSDSPGGSSTSTSRKMGNGLHL
jgi:hypothetical protein